MRKITQTLGLFAAASLLATAPASAQNLTWFGSTACFGAPNPSNRVTVANCNLSSSTSTSMSWDSNDGSSSRSSIDFQINEYNNGASSTDWPGGPTSNASTNRTLSFGSVGSTQNLYLGYWDFDQVSGDDLVSAFLSMNLFFDGSTLNLANNLKIEGVEQGTCYYAYQGSCYYYVNQPDGILVSGFNNPVAFSVGTNNYEFRYTGFDNWNNNSPNTASNYCQGAVDNPLPATFTGDTQRKLCGSITYTGSTVPEPATLTLVAAGLAGLVGVARRRRAV